MKPILIISSILALTMFSQLNNEYEFINLEIDLAYLLENSEAEIDTFITCESCHGDLDTYPASVGLELMSSFDESLIVHQENSPQFVEGLETFVETHDESQAQAKYVDRQKIMDLIAEL